MAQLVYIDDDILRDSEQWSKDAETFDKALDKIVNDTTRYADDKALWVAFSDAQRRVVEEYYKGFAIDTYSELEGTVRLQIAQKDARVKQRIKEMETDLGFAIKPDEWAYDGFKDLVDKRAACNFCKGSKATLRYVHYAINKKRNVTLRFGCDCAANFFSTAPETFTTIKTLQSKLLCDIRTIACLCDEIQKGNKDILKYYYRYKGKYIGRLFIQDNQLLSVEECVKRLEELYTYKIETTADGAEFKGNDEQGYAILYRNSTTPVVRSATWVKEHIVYCVNADLDDKYNYNLEARKIVMVDTKAHLKNDTTAYVNCAIRFIRAGLPVPMMVCAKITSKVASATKQHHPDYLRFATELLLHKNLSKASLLRTAFTEFFVNYVTTKGNTNLRDPELKEWGINGIASFYNTVLSWEAALVRLQTLNEYKKLVKAGYIDENRMRFVMLNTMKVTQGNVPSFLTADRKVREYIYMTTGLFLSNKPVIRDEQRMDNGMSKYMVQDIDTPIYTDNSIQHMADAYVDARYAPYHITIAYKLYQAALKRLMNSDFNTYKVILTIIANTTDEEQLVKVLLAFTLCGVTAQEAYKKLTNWYSVATNKLPELLIEKYYNVQLDSSVQAFLKDTTNKKEMTELRKTAVNLLDNVMDLVKKLTSVDVQNMKITDVQNENKRMLDTSTVNIVEKSAVDYYKTYCNMLTNKPATETITNQLTATGFKPILVFKDMQVYKQVLFTVDDLCTELRMFAILDQLERKVQMTAYFNAVTYAVDDWTTVLRTWLIEENHTDITGGIDPETFAISRLDSELLDYLHKEVFEYSENKETGKSKFNAYRWQLMNEYKELLSDIRARKDLSAVLKKLIMFFKCNKNISKSKLMAVTSIDALFDYIKPDTQFYNMASTYSSNMCKLLKRQNCFDLCTLYKETVHNALDKAYTEFMAENAQRLKDKADREKKQPYVDTISTTCNEHIAVFEINVTDKLKAKYPGRSNTDILRKEAFKVTRYEDAETKLKHFYETLTQVGFSDDCTQYMEMARKYIEGTETLNRQRTTALAETLCTELYNNNYIFNHIQSITLPVLKQLQDIDLYTMSVEDLQQVQTIVSRYYLTYTDMYALCEIVEKYSDNKAVLSTFVTETNSLEIPVKIALDKKYATLADLPDDSGLTGVDKAEKVLKHTDVLRIPDMLMRICRTVVSYKSCSQKQLHYVNKAYAILFPDEVVTEVNDATLQDTGNVTEEPNTYVALAETVKAHEQFDTLPEKNKAIIESVLERRTCSTKQFYWVQRSAKELGITVSATVDA